MLDLIRLMFDGGATMAPKRQHPSRMFQWNGRTWTWRTIEADEAPDRDPIIMRGLFVYNTDDRRTSRHHIDDFAADPVGYMVGASWNQTMRPGFDEPVFRERFGDPVILVFVAFEEVL